jgi:predicted ATP-dependent serine protease
MASPNPARRYGLLSFQDLLHAADSVEKEYLVDGLIPAKSLNILLGPSGVGKTPLMLQLAIAIASGQSFLGSPVKQGRVLYDDFENGVLDVTHSLQQIVGHLDLSAVPEALKFWNIHVCEGPLALPALVEDFKPDLVIIDSLSGYNPDIERDTRTAMGAFHTLRMLIRKHGCAFMLIVHPRKQGEEPVSLEHIHNVRDYFQITRGASALVNGSDLRLAVDRPDVTGIREVTGLGRRPLSFSAASSGWATK